MSFYICEYCGKAIRIEDFKKHQEKNHLIAESISKINIDIKNILDRSKDRYPRDKKFILRVSFDIAINIFQTVENDKSSNFSIIYDYQIKEFLDQIIATTNPPYPPIMTAIKGIVKDEVTYNELLKKYKGTKDEDLIRGMVGSRKEVVIYLNNYLDLIRENRKKGMENSDIIFLTVFWFLHEFYHIIGEGEKMADTKASLALLKALGQRIVIPDYELERWKEYEEFYKKYYL